MELKQKLALCGVHVPKILLPKAEYLPFWGVVACDQYTSEPEYWNRLKQTIGDHCSTLSLILPEAFLKDSDSRIPAIQASMQDYLKRGIFNTIPNMVYVERSTPLHPRARKGLMVCLDLDMYDFSPSSRSMIRATEGTVIERIPPRLRIREGAELESPHILVLIDDPNFAIIEPLSQAKDSFELLYDTDLLMDSGNVKGWRVPESSLAQVEKGFAALKDPVAYKAKYGVEFHDNPLLLAIGDGNHSLAAAKRGWENVKSSFNGHPPCDHPARFALVELENVHDPAIEFEPIHRVLFGLSENVQIVDVFQNILRAPPATALAANPALQRITSPSLTLVSRAMASAAELDRAVHEAVARQESHANEHVVGIIQPPASYLLVTLPALHTLPVGTLQFLIDTAGKAGLLPFREIDYTHGLEVTAKMGCAPGNAAVVLPAMPKNALFLTVLRNSVLPRKTFSMGHAPEKRFYIECRGIVLH